jgi:hypothetical protein
MFLRSEALDSEGSDELLVNSIGISSSLTRSPRSRELPRHLIGELKRSELEFDLSLLCNASVQNPLVSPS